MTDEIKLRMMQKKPTLDDIVEPNMSSDAKVVFRVSMRRAKEDQRRLLKRATAI